MTEPLAAAPAEPDGAPRIAMLDILRGVAILGILFMNINDMGQSLWASFGDIRHLGWSPPDRVAWWLREVLANGTARCMLEMLFGAGMVILTDRFAQRASGWHVLRRYYLRNFVLFLFGLVHVFVLLWPGDILHTYGLAALVAVWFRKLRARILIMVGLTLAVVQLLGGSLGVFVEAQRVTAVARIETARAAGQPISAADRLILKRATDARRERDKRHAETAAQIAREDVARRGGFADWAQAQWRSFLTIEGYGLEILFVWEAAATMLIGAGLFKLGVLQGALSRRRYAILLALGYGVGGTLRLWSGWEQTRFDGAVQFAGPFYELARLAMTLGHVALLCLLAKSAAGARLLQPFVAAGRTALSLYVCQTLVTLWLLFPPVALGLYGKLSWMPLMLTALAIDAVLLVLANWWVRRFAIAPVEWAWRSLIDGRRLPWRRSP